VARRFRRVEAVRDCEAERSEKFVERGSSVPAALLRRQVRDAEIVGVITFATASGLRFAVRLAHVRIP
jgi:hypothetical protein